MLELCQIGPASSSRLKRESSAAIKGAAVSARQVSRRVVESLFMVVSPIGAVVERSSALARPTQRRAAVIPIWSHIDWRTRLTALPSAVVPKCFMIGAMACILFLNSEKSMFSRM